MNKVRFKQWDCVLRRGTYANGRIALYLEDAETFENIAKCTVNIDGVPLKDDEAFIKDYSENEGMLDALLDSGAVEETGDFVRVNYGSHDVVFHVVRVKENSQCPICGDFHDDDNPAPRACLTGDGE